MTSQQNNPTEHRVYFRDVKPYAVVDSLNQLRGPAGGVVELSHSVLWAPGGGRVDLDQPGGVGLAYRVVLAEGTIEDLVSVLNRGRLVAVAGLDAASPSAGAVGGPVPRAARRMNGTPQTPTRTV